MPPRWRVRPAASAPQRPHDPPQSVGALVPDYVMAHPSRPWFSTGELSAWKNKQKPKDGRWVVFRLFDLVLIFTFSHCHVVSDWRQAHGVQTVVCGFTGQSGNVHWSYSCNLTCELRLAHQGDNWLTILSQLHPEPLSTPIQHSHNMHLTLTSTLSMLFSNLHHLQIGHTQALIHEASWTKISMHISAILILSQ